VKASDFMIEQAEARVLAETSHKLAAVSGRLNRPGSKTCRDCGDPINEERHRAAPFAVRCFECQQRSERKR
jgi:phage/conjugal plasmid C-4 type zinc finger TraR family protein